MGRGESGDIWVVSLPTFRINPITLELQGFELDFFDQLGFTPTDVAVDPTDGTVLFGGTTSDGSSNFAAIRRYDPATDQVTVVWDDPGPNPISGVYDLIVEPTGELGFRSADQRLFRLDPAVGTPVELSDFATVPSYGTLALDEDGSYLITPNLSAPPVIDVAPDTGQHTTITPDLKALLPSALLPARALAAGANGDIFFAYLISGLGVLHREPAVTAEELVPFDIFGRQILDLAIGSAGPCTDGDGDGVSAGSGCPGASPQDCDDADPDVYPGAPEINDGKDNQCPGDPGAGVVDEIEGPVTFDASTAPTRIFPRITASQVPSASTSTNSPRSSVRLNEGGEGVCGMSVDPSKACQKDTRDVSRTGPEKPEHIRRRFRRATLAIREAIAELVDGQALAPTSKQELHKVRAVARRNHRHLVEYGPPQNDEPAVVVANPVAKNEPRQPVDQPAAEHAQPTSIVAAARRVARSDADVVRVELGDHIGQKGRRHAHVGVHPADDTPA